MEDFPVVPQNIRTNKPIDIKKLDPKVFIYLISFLYAMHLTPLTYVVSNFFAQFIGDRYVGYIYMAASIVSIASFVLIKNFLRVKGNYKLFSSILLTDLVCLIVLSISCFIEPTPLIVGLFIICYVVSSVAHALGFLSLDIFLEHYSKDGDTGETRGLLLTFENVAYIIGPVLGGLMISFSGNISIVFIFGMLVLIPLIFLARRFFGEFKDSVYERTEMLPTIFKIYHNPDLSKIFSANFILNFFYGWMIIYTPLFLHQVIGFSFGEVAVIIGIALIPFILLQLFLGRIADNYFGEKEILSAGFIIAALATAYMSFAESNSFIFWTALLFTTRIGASMIEVMCETYLFKKINDGNINILGFYRLVRSCAYIFATLTASILLIFISPKFLFLVLGVILIYGLRFSLSLNDTK